MNDMRSYKQKGDKVIKVTTYALQRKCSYCDTKFEVRHPQSHTRSWCGQNSCTQKRKRAKAKAEGRV